MSLGRDFLNDPDPPELEPQPKGVVDKPPELHAEGYPEPLLVRLIDLHSAGHRSQHWFDIHRKDTDRYVSFCLYNEVAGHKMITAQGPTFIKALQAVLELWDSAM